MQATTRKACDAAANQLSYGARKPRPRAAPMRASFGKQMGHRIAARTAPTVPSFSSWSFMGAGFRWGLTFELSGRQRLGALDSKRKMGRRPSA